jgi:DNA-directed RNA polymerase specialized sigma24 family protein
MQLTAEEFLMSYQDLLTDLGECQERYRELYYPQRGNKIATGEHAGISNQPEEYAIIKEKLERKIAILEKMIPKRKKRIETFLRQLKPQQAKILHKKYLDGANTLEMAAWMHITQKSAIAAIKFAMEAAEKEYSVFCSKLL